MTVEDAKFYFYDLHDKEVNQRYAGTLPYSFHLKMVFEQAKKFDKLIPISDDKDSTWYVVTVSCFGHDAIEDARKTYNDIEEVFGKQIADIVYCCTEEKGRNRNERHSERFYKELAENDLAVFVKLCDIIANVKYSLLSNSTMYNKYKKEFKKTKEYLYKEKYKEMFDYLEKLLTIN